MKASTALQARFEPRTTTTTIKRRIRHQGIYSYLCIPRWPRRSKKELFRNRRRVFEKLSCPRTSPKRQLQSTIACTSSTPVKCERLDSTRRRARRRWKPRGFPELRRSREGVEPEESNPAIVSTCIPRKQKRKFWRISQSRKFPARLWTRWFCRFTPWDLPTRELSYRNA